MLKTAVNGPGNQGENSRLPAMTATLSLGHAGRGRRPKAPWQSVTEWRQALPGDTWTHLTVRAGEKGPVEIALVRRRVQARIERKRTGPAEWLVITRRPLSDDRTLETQASRAAYDQDTCYGYRYYLRPTQTHKSEL